LKIRKVFKYELMPNSHQVALFFQFAGCCRKVWNIGLALCVFFLKSSKYLGYPGLAKLLVQWKKSSQYAYLAKAHAQILQQALKDLDRAFQNFFVKRAGFPKFKKKGRKDSFRYPQGFKLDQLNSRIWLPKIGWVRFRLSRPIEGVPKQVTIMLDVDKWHVSIQTEFSIDTPETLTGPIVGLDMGVVRFATFSDGTVIPPVRLDQCERNLRRRLRALARKKKGGKNFKKAKLKVAKCYRKIRRCRLDHAHKASTDVANNHGVVVVEDLKVASMTKSAKGDLESPGRNVKAKSGLNRAILNQGWGRFRILLESKLAIRGGTLIRVSPHHTSQKCPSCGHVAKENRKSQADFACVACGYENNADIVGALNVLAAGQAVRSNACGGLGAQGPPMKQEPAEEIKTPSVLISAGIL
jgi:putative transposase